MASEFIFPTTANKAERYRLITEQIKGITTGETDLIANLANTASMLKYGFNFFWVGFYLVKSNELVLGPFQGTSACTRIAFGKGVCGSAYTQKQTLLVPDVEAFPGHIACSSASKSEIVVPIFNKKNEVIAIIDVDSDSLNDFDEVDKENLEIIARLMADLFENAA
jgi:L-methionine (R)-S-oxide reductase